MKDRRRLCLARVPGNGRHRRWHGAGDEDGPEMPLDAHIPQPTLNPMDLRGNQTPTLRRPAKRLSLLWVVASGFGCCLGVLPATAVPSAVAGETPQPILEFIERTNNAVFIHPMPVDRENEVDDDVCDSPRSIIIDIAENRLHAQKAIMALTMA